MARIQTYSEYLILIAFLLQQWLRESASYVIRTFNVLLKVMVFSFTTKKIQHTEKRKYSL